MSNSDHQYTPNQGQGVASAPALVPNKADIDHYMRQQKQMQVSHECRQLWREVVTARASSGVTTGSATTFADDVVAAYQLRCQRGQL